ncbi:hypothetical protein HPB50_028817 [Hyalomma asiaticum]|nr:hypothetical protein HPB50_028817 [Hyalomma asiaticum]
MSHMFGLCCCNACESCWNSLSAGLSRCLGIEDQPEVPVELELGPLQQQPTGRGAEASSVSVAQGPPTGHLKTVRSSDGIRPIGSVYMSSIWSDVSASSDPDTEPSLVGSLVGSTVTKQPGGDSSSPEGGSSVEGAAGGDKKDVKQSSSASESEGQAGKPGGNSSSPEGGSSVEGAAGGDKKDVKQSSSASESEGQAGKVRYLRDSLNAGEMALSGAGFFSLKLRMLVSLAGTVITYTVILVQTSESVKKR